MSITAFLKCNQCEKIADSDNHYKEGWIELGGTLSKGSGKYNQKNGSYESQWINATQEKKHFCSWGCLEIYNDNKR